jgi:hypothetical protein
MVLFLFSPQDRPIFQRFADPFPSFPCEYSPAQRESKNRERGRTMIRISLFPLLSLFPRGCKGGKVRLILGEEYFLYSSGDRFYQMVQISTSK